MDSDQPGPVTAAASDRRTVDWPAELARHERWLRTVIGARLGERQAVDEVFQEVSLAAIAQRAPLADASKAAPWLYQLAVRQTLLYRRKAGRRRKLWERVRDRSRPDEGPSRSDDPLEWLLAAERHQLIREALAKLPRRDAEILLLKYSEDWSYHQLAEHLGISHSAVEARLHRARARMREVLSEVDIVESTGKH